MTINKIYDTLLDYVDKSIAIQGPVETKAREALKGLRNLRWRPVAEGEFPENESIVLADFENLPVPAVLTYREDEEGGAFYDDGDSMSNYGIIVSAWRPLDRYEE